MKNWLYKLVINHVTDYCYSNCLSYFRNNSAILDVGIGNGVMIENHHSLIKSKGLHITGIDINKDYLQHCENLIRTYQLQDYIQLRNMFVETYEPKETFSYDYILFSMSFMLFDNQRYVLDRIKEWLKPEGEIIFFQTMFKKRSQFMEFVKPKLKYLTTVDFGSVTYDKDFFTLLNDKNLKVSEDRLIKKEWFKGEYRMVVASFDESKEA